MTEPAPIDKVALVDDLFWLNQAGRMVLNGADLRVDAARQLMSALAWLWTVYTGTSVLGLITAGDRFSTTQGVLLAVPAILIVCAYSAAVWAYMPVPTSFDPRDPEEVRQAFAEATRRGRGRLTIALILSMVTAVALAVAVGSLALI